MNLPRCRLDLIGLITIERAAVNRGEIANGFVSALADIGFEIAYWEDQLAAFHGGMSIASSAGLLGIVVQFFTILFRFIVSC